MAVDKKISQLASGAPAQAGDEYVVARSGANYKLTLTNIAGNMPATTISSGNLTFSSTGQRITGDMSNATVANRLFFQNSTTNAATRIGAIPNGTATESGYNFYNTSAVTTGEFGQLYITSSEVTLRSAVLAGGSFLPLTFYTGGSERMQLNTSGNLGIGTASPAFASGDGLEVQRAADATVRVERTGATASAGEFVASSGLVKIGATSGSPFTFITDNTERMRLDASGNVGIGMTPGAANKVDVGGTLPTSSNYTEIIRAGGTIPSGSTSNASCFISFPSTQAASFTLTSLYHFRAVQNTFGASSAVTNQFGFFCGGNLTGATSNFGFYSDIASGSNRWNFYANGTARNYFAGDTGIGTTGTNPIGDNAVGTVIFGSGAIAITRDSNPPLLVNRKTNDGNLVEFYQDGVLEGSISVAGNVVSYNPFMGSHYTEIVGAMPTLKGTVLESLDELVDGKCSSQNRLPKAKVSDTEGSSTVYGVYFSPDSDPETNNGILAAALGASWVRIAAGVTVQRGDLLESNGDGCAKVQSDDIIRSKTIGKVTSTTVADTYADGSYIVPCVLYCG